jgi:hypothetical protein
MFVAGRFPEYNGGLGEAADCPEEHMMVPEMKRQRLLFERGELA